MVEAVCKGATQDRDAHKESLLKAKRTAVVRPYKDTCNLSFFKHGKAIRRSSLGGEACLLGRRVIYVLAASDTA